MSPDNPTTPTSSVYAAASTAGTHLRARARYASLLTEALPAFYQMSREEAARRCGGFSRSWINRFLKDNADRIPREYLPDAQLVVNRVPVEFVRWFLASGRLLPRRDRSAGGRATTADVSGENQSPKA